MLQVITNKNFNVEIDLPASKSIHNRLLILNALYDLNLEILNPSYSNDSILLQKLLKSDNSVLYCENAGTVYRFLTAYFSVLNKTVILSGSERMLNRPIGDLVTALQNSGAKIKYTGKEGFPPLEISGGLITGGTLSVNGEVSSQFISALAMIGPKTDKGLEIVIEGRISSKPYIEMTVKLMQNIGFDIHFEYNRIICKPRNGITGVRSAEVEPDWSAVAFWFQIIMLSTNGKVLLNKLKKQSIQGDSVLSQWAGMLGIKLSESPSGILLEKSSIPVLNDTTWNLTNYPDLAPSLIVLLSCLKRRARFKGLESLKIKESDRTLALQTELKKCRVSLTESGNEWILDASDFFLEENTVFEHYNDHRIAMALAPLALINPLKMENTEVVNKSYPDFWKHLKKLES